MRSDIYLFLMLISLFIAILLPAASPFPLTPQSPVASIPRQKTATVNYSHYHPHHASFSSIIAHQIRKRSPLSAVLKVSDGTGSISYPLCSSQTNIALEGKNVILTGASGGLGKALAIQFTNANVKTLILSGRDSESLEAVRKSCNRINNPTASHQHPSEIHIVPCDLFDTESVDKFATECLRLCKNQVDVLVNNGGISSRSKFIDTSSDVDELLMRVNFLSGAALTKRIVPYMVANNGNDEESKKIIWISSIQGLIGTPFRTSYAASKFAVQGYCEAMRSELASSNVSVHVVSPGYIRTNLSLSAVCGDGSTYGKMDKNTANGADPNKVAVKILNLVTRGRHEFLVAASPSAKIALFIKKISPSLLRTMLVKRFKKDPASSQ